MKVNPNRLQRGDRRGQLTYLGPAMNPKFARDRPGTWAWFHCTCGTVKKMRRYIVSMGRTTSCGCRKGPGIRAVHLASVREAEAKKRAAGVR